MAVFPAPDELGDEELDDEEPEDEEPDEDAVEADVAAAAVELDEESDFLVDESLPFDFSVLPLLERESLR